MVGVCRAWGLGMRRVYSKGLQGFWEGGNNSPVSLGNPKRVLLVAPIPASHLGFGAYVLGYGPGTRRSVCGKGLAARTRTRDVSILEYGLAEHQDSPSDAC